MFQKAPRNFTYTHFIIVPTVKMFHFHMHFNADTLLNCSELFWQQNKFRQKCIKNIRKYLSLTLSNKKQMPVCLTWIIIYIVAGRKIT